MKGYARIGDACLVGDGTHSKIERQDCGVLYLTSRNFKDGSLDLSKVYYISEHDYTKHFLGEGKALVQPKTNDLVFSIIGTIGESYLVRQTDRFGISSSVAIIRPNRVLIDPTFLLHWFKGPVFQHALFGIKGGVAQGYVSLEMIRSLPVPTLPLPVQQRIAGILSTYDELIENNQRRIRILEDMARSLYREWFVHFRYPSHESVPLVNSPLGQIPQGWAVHKMGDIADIKWGDTSKTKSSYVEEGYAAYSASGLDGKMDHYDFDQIGIVLSAIGAQCGKTWLARAKWSCIKNTIRFWSKDDCVSTEFLFVATDGQNFWPRRGAAQPFISQGDAERIELLISDRVTMKRFTVFVANAFEHISTLQEQTASLRRTRDLLLPRLLSGQVALTEQATK